MTPSFWIRASEIQAYGFCARSWWLQYVLGLEPEDKARLVDGADRHEYYGRRVVRAEGYRRVGLWVLLIALLLAGLAVLWLLRGG